MISERCRVPTSPPFLFLLFLLFFLLHFFNPPLLSSPFNVPLGVGWFLPAASRPPRFLTHHATVPMGWTAHVGLHSPGSTADHHGFPHGGHLLQHTHSHVVSRARGDHTELCERSTGEWCVCERVCVCVCVCVCMREIAHHSLLYDVMVIYRSPGPVFSTLKLLLCIDKF